MSSKKDRELAQKEGAFRDGRRGPPPAPQGKQWVKCQYPPCQHQVLIEEVKASPLIVPKPQATKTPPFCELHWELIQFMMWLLPRVQVQKGVTPHGVVLPGSQEYAAPPTGGVKP